MTFRTNVWLAGFVAVSVGLIACGEDEAAPIAAASGGSAGAKAGAAGAAGAKAGAAGATAGGSAGATAGGSAGTTAGGSAGTTAGGSAGTTAGGSAGATAGGSAGATAGGSAGATAGGSAGATAGGSAGATAGGSAGATAGGSAGATAGGSAGSGDAGSAGSAGAAAGGSAGSSAGGAAGSQAGGAAGAGGSEPIPSFAAIALGPGGAIYRFDTDAPNSATSATVSTGGLGGPVALVGIDYRPSDGLLYGATNTTLYQLTNALLGSGLTAGSAQTFDPDFGGAGQGFDFNPAATITVDGSGNPLRVIGYGDGSNGRYNPTNGKRLAADTKLAYDDALNTQVPQIAGAAYTNNRSGVTETKLFVLDGRTDGLLQVDPPNSGVAKPVASLGIDITDLAGFDIVTVTGVDSVVKDYGFAVIGDSLYTIRLTPGAEPAAKLVGKVQGASQLRGLAVALAPK